MARKSKEFDELLRANRTEKLREKGIAELKKKVKKAYLGEMPEKILIDPKDKIKMSEVLYDFIEPYSEGIESKTERYQLLTLAVLAWNLSLLSEDKQQEGIEMLIKEGTKGSNAYVQEQTRMVIDELIQRKTLYFADYTQVIVDFSLQETGDEYNISVASIQSDSNQVS